MTVKHWHTNNEKNQRRQQLKLVSCWRRLSVIVVMYVTVFSLLGLRIVEVAWLSGGKDESAAFEFAQAETFGRAEIVDREEQLLAINLSAASLYANPKKVMDVDEVIEKINTILPDVSADTLRRRLASDRSFIWIKRGLTPIEQYHVNALGLPGLYFENEERRVYPHKQLLSHVLGYVGVDETGLSGVEKYYDEQLSDINSDKPLVLSLDVRVQDILRTALIKRVEKYKAKGAAGVVMDSRNGEIIAMVSLPDFDSNTPQLSPQNHRFNRATYGVYEMGSTFKTFTLAMGLENGSITMLDDFNVQKPLRVANFTIRDYHPKKGRLSVPEIFMFSSNIGTAQIALEVGGVKQQQFLRELGLMEQITVELPERSNPLLPSRWGKVHTTTVSYGHGMAVTPLHVVKATAALINGGIMYEPTIIKGGNKFSLPYRVVSEETSREMRKLLRYAVSHGTGSRADAKGYLVGGKTGSADKPNQQGGYASNAIISSFVGAFPMNEPQYVVMTMFDEPKVKRGFVTGGVVAAPAVKEVISRIGPILGVDPVDYEDYNIRDEFWFELEKEGQEVATISTG